MKRKRVICYGASSGFESLYYGVNAIYNVVGVSDKDSEKRAIADKYGIRYIEPQQLVKEEFDYIVITSEFEKQIKSYLINEVGIQQEQVIGYTEFLAQREYHFGEKNPAEYIYILRRMDTSNGLNILILEYLYYLRNFEKLEQFHVVMDACNYSTIYHNTQNVGKQNIIEYYYKVNCDISLKEAYESSHVVLSSAAMLFEKVENITKMQRDICKNDEIRCTYRKLYDKYFILKDSVKSSIEQQRKKYIEPIHNQGKKICAVVDRSRGYNHSKTWGHYIQPNEEFSLKKLKELKEKWGYEYILLDTHSKQTEMRYRDVFGDKIICTERTRIDTDKVIQGGKKIKITSQRINDEYLQGEELLVSRYLLAQCDFFYSGISGSSTFPILIQNRFEDMFVYENGRFGFEEAAENGVF